MSIADTTDSTARAAVPLHALELLCAPGDPEVKVAVEALESSFYLIFEGYYWHLEVSGDLTMCDIMHHEHQIGGGSTGLGRGWADDLEGLQKLLADPRVVKLIQDNTIRAQVNAARKAA
jgi:hypothetical protein